MFYSGLISEHFRKPRNVGEVDGPAFVGRAGSIRCGAIVKVSLRIEPQCIAEARFKAAGCSTLVAAASLLTERIKGRPAAEAAVMARNPAGIFGAEASTDGAAIACAGIVCQAVLSAIWSFSDSVRQEWEGDEALICSCFSVSEGTIEREIEQRRLSTIADVTRACRAGGGCRSCHPLIEDMLEDFQRHSVAAGAMP
jgi:NifU-like protein